MHWGEAIPKCAACSAFKGLFARSINYAGLDKARQSPAQPVGAWGTVLANGLMKTSPLGGTMVAHTLYRWSWSV